MCVCASAGEGCVCAAGGVYSGVISLCPESFELKGGEESVNNVFGAAGCRELQLDRAQSMEVKVCTGNGGVGVCVSYNNHAVVLWGMWGLNKNVAILHFRSAVFNKTAINNVMLLIMWGCFLAAESELAGLQ